MPRTNPPKRAIIGRVAACVALLILAIAVITFILTRNPHHEAISPQTQETAQATPAQNPTAQDDNPLLIATRVFVHDYWSYGPDDTPTKRRQRAASHVIDPKNFVWQSDFIVEKGLQVEAALDEPSFNVGDLDLDEGEQYVEMDIILTDHSMPSHTLLQSHTEHQAIYFKLVNGVWKVEAEEAR